MTLPDKPTESLHFTFLLPKKVSVAGYDQDIMEPFISKDGKYLFFNNLNDPATTNTNIFLAERIDDTTFIFRGELQGVNSSALDAVTSMDSENNFYFVSTRSYGQNLSTIYRGMFSNGNVSTVSIVSGISKNQPGMVNFDVEVSADGTTLYFADGDFSSTGKLNSANLAMAKKDGSGFQRLKNSDQILNNINSNELEYAACISKDQLTLYFTRIPSITTTVQPRIFYATRNNKNEPFGNPNEILELEGFVEARTPSPDETNLFYHKRENNHLSFTA